MNLGMGPVVWLSVLNPKTWLGLIPDLGILQCGIINVRIEFPLTCLNFLKFYYDLFL